MTEQITVARSTTGNAIIRQCESCVPLSILVWCPRRDTSIGTRSSGPRPVLRWGSGSTHHWMLGTMQRGLESHVLLTEAKLSARLLSMLSLFKLFTLLANRSEQSVIVIYLSLSRYIHPLRCMTAQEGGFFFRGEDTTRMYHAIL